MTDLATLGIAVDSRPAVKAASDLDMLTASAQKAEQATGTMGARITSSAGQAQTATAKIAAEAVRLQMSAAGFGGQGVAGIIEKIAVKATAALGPLSLLAAGFITLGLAFAKAYSDFAAGQKALEDALHGIGGASGATVERLNDIAAASAKAAGVTVTQSRSIAAALASTGRIGVEQIGGLIEITKRFAVATNQDIPEASATLAKMFSDPIAGMKEYEGSIGTLSERTRDYITNLVEQNDKIGAQIALRDQLAAGIPPLAQDIGLLTRAWNAVAAAASGAWAAMGKAINVAVNGAPLAQQITEQQKVVESLRSRLGSLGPDTGWSPIETEATKLTRQLQAADDKLRQLQMTAGKLGLAAEMKRAADEANQLSQATGKILNAGNPLAAQYQKLANQMATLEKARDSPLATSALTDRQQGQLATEIERTTRAMDSLKDSTGNLYTAQSLKNAQDKLAIEIAQAKTPADKARLAAEKSLLDNTGKLLTTTEAQTQAENAATLARLRGVGASKTASDAMDAYDRAMRRSQDAVEELKFQATQFGKTSEELYKLTEQHKLYRAALSAGRADEAGVTEAINQQAEAYAKAKVAAENMAETQRRIADLNRFTQDTFSGLIKDTLAGLRDGESFWKAFEKAGISALNKISDKLIDMAVSDLFTNAFGGKGSGGLFGSIFSLFGGADPGSASNPLAGLSASDYAANGKVFGASGVMPFALGGAFSNSIVNRPTLFPFANGTGLMGEAGPEAIMPLKRGPGGALGVAVHGAGSSNDNSPMSFTYAPSYSVQGGTSEDIEGLKKVIARDHGEFESRVKKIVGDRSNKNW